VNNIFASSMNGDENIDELVDKIFKGEKVLKKYF
jgi:hypothetical protein